MSFPYYLIAWLDKIENIPLSQDHFPRSVVTPRLMRHFHLLNIPDLAVSTMQRIFSSIMQVMSILIFSLEKISLCDRMNNARNPCADCCICAGLPGDFPVRFCCIIEANSRRNSEYVQGNTGTAQFSCYIFNLID